MKPKIGVGTKDRRGQMLINFLEQQLFVRNQKKKKIWIRTFSQRRKLLNQNKVNTKR